MKIEEFKKWFDSLAENDDLKHDIAEYTRKWYYSRPYYDVMEYYEEDDENEVL